MGEARKGLIIYILFTFCLMTGWSQPGQLRATAAEKQAQVVDIRFWAYPDYTRVAIDCDGPTTHTHRLLREDPQKKLPQRLYIDLKPAVLTALLKKPRLVQNSPLTRIRAGQFSREVARVVFEAEGIREYKIFTLDNPFRVVVDIYGGKSTAKGGGKKKAGARKESGQRPTIVIDPGHGGKDPGALGIGGIREKDITLKIAKKLRSEITKELGYRVVLTREGDRFLTLEERTAIANSKRASLFISIHANSSFDKRAKGVETYYLNFPSDEQAIEVAARENFTSREEVSDLEVILTDLMMNSKINESSHLAGYVQSRIIKTLSGRYSGVKDLGVKQAPFFVLFGAKMPCVLVEVSFLSHATEGKRLKSSKYQDLLVRGITQGVKDYARKTQLTSLR